MSGVNSFWQKATSKKRIAVSFRYLKPSFTNIYIENIIIMFDASQVLILDAKMLAM
jgi:hypothetical protein